ncbi:MAG TPA: TIM barrel protein [Firmicutes bacterium]|nr:TIM barrel protein [Bacillota bacterium]
MGIPIGLQLYSLREDAKKDFVGVLKAVASMGYEGVEFAGYWGLSSQELKKILNDLGLRAVGSHIGFAELQNNLPSVLDFLCDLGAKFVVCPGAPRELVKDAEGWRNFARSMSDIGEKCKERGLRLGYHNHAWEITPVDGKYALDLFFEEACPESVEAQLDLGWLLYAGVDPVAYMKKYSGRCPLVHVKDFTKEKKQTEVGTGALDLDAVVATAPEAGVEWYLIETEEYNMPPVESVKVGLWNLKAHLGI